MSFERRRTILDSIKATQKFVKGGDQWQTQFDGPASYAETFRYILDRQPLERVLDKWPERSQVAGLDLMGSGVVFEGLHMQHGVGMALTDARPPVMKDRHAGAIDVVSGNILQQQTWSNVEEWIQQRGLEDPRFKLILFRPIGGVNYMPQDPQTLYTLFERAWKLLSDDDGEFLAVVPYSVCRLVEAWVRTLHDTEGITARMQTAQDILRVEQEEHGGLTIVSRSSPTEAIRFTKHRGAPEQLPMIDFVEENTDSLLGVQYHPKV